MMADERRRHDFPVTLAMCAPAVRLVVVTAWANADGTCGHFVNPVLALVAKQFHRYSRRSRGEGDYGEDTAPTHRGMVAEGWAYDTGGYVEFQPVLLDPDLGLCEASELREIGNPTLELAECHWPPDQDEARLAGLIEELKAKALRVRNLAEKARGKPSAVAAAP